MPTLLEDARARYLRDELTVERFELLVGELFATRMAGLRTWTPAGVRVHSRHEQPRTAARAAPRHRAA